jgi:hypothetical protein
MHHIVTIQGDFTVGLYLRVLLHLFAIAMLGLVAAMAKAVNAVASNVHGHACRRACEAQCRMHMAIGSSTTGWRPLRLTGQPLDRSSLIPYHAIPPHSLLEHVSEPRVTHSVPTAAFVRARFVHCTFTS